jgi:hypothetical protein
MDVTEWFAWFLDTLHRAVDQAQHTLDAVLTKARFWQRRATTPLNERQVELLNRLLDGFEGKIASSKWAAIARCSPDTALRDINDLLARGVLRKLAGGEMRPQLALSNASQGSQLRQLIPPRLRHATLPVVDRLGRHAHHLRKVGSGETKALASRNQPFGDEPNPFRCCWYLRRRPGISHLSLECDHLPLQGGNLALQVRDLPMVMSRQSFRLLLLCSNFLSGETSDLFFEDLGDIRHECTCNVASGDYVRPDAPVAMHDRTANQ